MTVFFNKKMYVFPRGVSGRDGIFWRDGIFSFQIAHPSRRNNDSFRDGKTKIQSEKNNAERSTEVGWTIIDRTERIIEPIEPTTDGPGGASAPPRTPPIVSAFGDTDGEFFGKNLQTAKKSRGWLGF